MNLTAYNFQFYSYNMPTHSYLCQDGGMDVDDVDMSIPPPKPPRASAVLNSPSLATFPPQPSWITSTPKSIVNDNQIMPTTAAVVETASLVPSVNYLTVPDETPKSIYSRGMTKAANASVQPAELQLRPKLHATQRRWSSELREKALEMSKRSSAGSTEENPPTSNHLPMQANEQELQLKPQHHAGRKSWSCEIREKALEMSKRISESLKASKEVEKSPSMQHLDTNTSDSKDNTQDSFTFQTPLNNKAAYEKINITSGVTSNSTNKESSQFNSTFEAYFKSPQPTNASDEQTQDPTQSVKDRICFFNKLTSSSCSNSFIDLLKNSNITSVATIQQASSAQTTPLTTPLKPKRWSTHLEMNLQQDSLTPTTQFSQTSANVQRFFTQTSNRKVATSSSLPSPSGKSSISTQRKSTLRRRASVDKTRRPILRQSTAAGSNGTKPQMHTVMEDLSLVMPVKLRIAEYERRILMDC